MIEVPMTRGFTALLDDEDEDLASLLNWYPNRSRGGVYAQARIPKTGKRIYMHRAVLMPPPSKQVHHKNGDTLDNRRSNLEVLTPARHQAEHRHLPDNGVHYVDGRFRAQSRIDGTHYSLGMYDFRETALWAVESARQSLPDISPKERDAVVAEIVAEGRRRNYRLLFPNGIM